MTIPEYVAVLNTVANDASTNVSSAQRHSLRALALELEALARAVADARECSAVVDRIVLLWRNGVTV